MHTDRQSGRYAFHLGQQTYNNLSPEGTHCGLNTSYTFLPAMLHDHAGYWCLGLGKWHQGFARKSYIPTSRGFDRFVGFYTGGETHFTHVTSYWVLAEEPEWWTPVDNTTLPNPSSCSLLWKLYVALSSVTCSLLIASPAGYYQYHCQCLRYTTAPSPITLSTSA